jgi:hypothetical protein
MDNKPETRATPMPQYSCARCHRPVDPYSPNAQRNPVTRKWEHMDCRTIPRRT